jgi:hypothetical protein
LEEPILCLFCKAPLQLLVEEENDEEEPALDERRPTYECIATDCVMKGRIQPQEKTSSTVSWNSDGNTQGFQCGVTPTNENNVPTTVARLLETLSGYEVMRLENESSKETGADILITCRGCRTTTEGQVVTTVLPQMAIETRKTGYAISSEAASETLGRLLDTIRKKTARYAPDDMASRLLVIDATVDTFWMAIFNRSAVAEETPWHGVVLVSPALLIWAKGMGPRCNCPAVST